MNNKLVRIIRAAVTIFLRIYSVSHVGADENNVNAYLDNEIIVNFSLCT